MSEDCPHCVYEKNEANCRGCFEGSNYRPKPATNADRIRSMSDEELAEWMALNSNCYYCKAKEAGRCDNFTTSPCNVIWLGWLKEEVASNG